MPPLDDARTRLLHDVAAARAAFAGAHVARVERLRAEVAAGFRPAIEAARRALEEANPGMTAAGSPLWTRAMAPWGEWADTTPSAAREGTGSLVRVGTLESMAVEGGPAWEVPALVPLVCRGNLVLEGSGAALERANDALQSVLFRLLAAVPPGKLRVTAIDAAGLGSSFADVLHLPEVLRGPKVWHEEREVAEALVELSSHMSMVIQKYLKSDFASIDAYNRIAGEVAEPYRILLVGGFPAGFRPEVAERLLSIAKNGPPLGVHVLLSLDAGASVPQGFQTNELLRHATVLRHRSGAWEWRDRPATVTLDPRPPREIVDALVAGLAPDAARADEVRVSFGGLLDAERWTGDATDGLVAPVGRRGARETLDVRVGHAGTAHHALVGGRTGSGKTMLLHALIVSLAWRYSPEELELWLVDFKEGVEFQAYRTLPHARVVAVQSEREFGLSVLEGLRAELERRGERFRARGLEDYAGWRRAGERLPRVVLVVDEFQVLFEGNDAMSNHARAHLADLTSRGRSFGIHVVLASQTLSAMDLDARTLSQIGVRVALQMSENDSYKVLGKDNDAARHLERPGEAIFNDAGGLPGHNVRFQAAFLPREEREHRVVELGTGHPVVFDGNRPADLGANVALGRWLDAPATVVPRGMDVWVGEPTRLVEGHVAWRLRRQARGNLLIVGNDEETAFVTVAAAVAAFVAQSARGKVRVLNLTNVDDPLHESFAVLAALGAEVGRAAQAEAMLGELDATRKARREAAAGQVAGEALPPPELLVVFGLQRGRVFDKQGLKVPPVTTQLAALVTDGPDVGLHAILWADTMSAVTRVLAPQEVAELGGRLALTGGDALRVLGNAAPAHVSLRRGSALLATDEDHERVEKIRCYGKQSLRWLRARLGME
ncbi:MAG: FtsK/SpoIIIE domain-containing protein [Myxococcota bacterium]